MAGHRNKTGCGANAAAVPQSSHKDHWKKQNFESTSALKDVNHTPRPNQDDPIIQGSCD